jgi:AcrR family transcriptional regulator
MPGSVVALPARKPDTRAAVLEAAERIVRERGAARLTLDEVAAAAGVSKGGLLYHFASKEALVEAMVARLVEKFGAIVARLAASAESGSSELAAYLEACFSEEAQGIEAVGQALVAALANDLKLLRPLREHYKRVFEGLRRDAPGFARGATVVLAVEGMFYMKILDMLPLRDAEIEAIAGELKALAAKRD